MRALRLIALAAVTAALLSASAEAAEWSAPEQVAPAGAYESSLQYLRGGKRLATWSTLGPRDGRRPGFRTASFFSVEGSDGWSAGRFPRVFTPTTVTGLSRGRALAIGTGYTRDNLDGDVATRVEAWSTRSALTGGDSRWSRQVVWRGVLSGGPVVTATNARGDAAVIWGAWLRGPRYAVLAATRRAGHRFGRVRRLSTGSVWRTFATAVNKRGDLMFAWQTGESVYAQAVSRRGRVGRRLRIPRVDTDPRVLGASIGARRELSVVWTAGGGGGRPAPLLHSRARGGRRFGSARVLDPCPENCLDTTVAGGRDGELFVAWQTRDQGGVISRVTALRSGARRLQEFGREYQDAYSPMSPIADSSGRAAILKSSHYSVVPSELRLAVAEPGGPFGPFERVPTNGDLSAVATDPVTGRISVLYAPRPVPPDYRPQPLQVVERR